MRLLMTIHLCTWNTVTSHWAISEHILHGSANLRMSSSWVSWITGEFIALQDLMASHTWNWPWWIWQVLFPKTTHLTILHYHSEQIIVSRSCMSQAHVHVQWVVWLQLSQHTDSCSVMHIMYWAIQSFISLSRKVWAHRYYPSRWIRLSTQQLDAQILIDIPPSLLSYHDTQIVA